MSNKTVYMQSESGNVFSTSHPEFHSRDKRLPAADGKRLYREQMRADMLTYMKPGDKVYTTLRSVSSSGMSRRISLFVVRDGGICCIDFAASVVMDARISDKGGIVATGCGMDMGFHLVYNLGRYLWPNGTTEPHGVRNGKPDRDGGYALNHSWL